MSSNRSTGRVKADLTPSKKSSKKSSIPATKDAKVPEVLSFEGEKEEQSVEGPAAEAPRPTLQEYYNQIIESKSLEQSETMAG